MAPRARRAFPAPACGRTPRRPQACALHSLTCAGPQGARAGWRHRSRRPCPASRFGRWAPKVQRGPRRHPPYSLKGSVPEAPAYVSVRLCMDLGGGGGAQPRAPLGRSSVQGPRGAALYVLLTDQVCLWILRRRALATWATWRLQRCSNAANAVTARVAATMLARNGRQGARIASALFAGSVCKAPQMRHARLRLCLRQASRTHTHAHTRTRVCVCIYVLYIYI